MRLSCSVLLAVLGGCATPRTPEITVGYLDAEDGLDLSVLEVEGPGEGPTLFFLHGWSCDFDTWNEQIPVFASRGYRVVAIDLAGHGTSGRQRGSWTIEQLGRDVVHVAEELDLRRLVLVGHSMGATVAVEAAARIPDRVELVVAADALQDLDFHYEEEVVDGLIGALEEDFPGTTAKLVRSMFHEDSDPEIRASMVDSMSRADAEVGVGLMRSYNDYPLEERASRLTVPIVAILAPDYPADVEGNRRLVPGYEAHVIPGSDHFLMMGEPEAFNELLQEALDRRGLSTAR